MERKEPTSQGRTVKEFKKVRVQTLDKHCDSGLYKLEYHLLDHMVAEL